MQARKTPYRTMAHDAQLICDLKEIIILGSFSRKYEEQKEKEEKEEGEREKKEKNRN